MVLEIGISMTQAQIKTSDDVLSVTVPKFVWFVLPLSESTMWPALRYIPAKYINQLRVPAALLRNSFVQWKWPLLNDKGRSQNQASGFLVDAILLYNNRTAGDLCAAKANDIEPDTILASQRKILAEKQKKDVQFL